VEAEKLSQAIGRGGQNIKLASQLIRWNLNVMDEAEAEDKSDSEARELQGLFMEHLDVDEEVAAILVQEGFSSLDEVAYVPRTELLEIEEFDEGVVDELRGRARDALLTKAIASEEVLDEARPAQDLLEMEGMDSELAYKMATKGILTMEDLAEQSVDEVMEIEGLDKERASDLIMKARAPWFEQEEQG
jgi:N utilization substance protein A